MQGASLGLCVAGLPKRNRGTPVLLKDPVIVGVRGGLRLMDPLQPSNNPWAAEHPEVQSWRAALRTLPWTPLGPIWGLLGFIGTCWFGLSPTPWLGYLESLGMTCRSPPSTPNYAGRSPQCWQIEATSSQVPRCPRQICTRVLGCELFTQFLTVFRGPNTQNHRRTLRTDVVRTSGG